MTENRNHSTLYVCDLDGTLLDRDATLPAKTAEHLRILAERGIAVTYSTARTERTVSGILDGVPLGYPVTLMNGTIIKDFGNNRNISVHTLDREYIAEIDGRCVSYGITPFIYSVSDNSLFTYYCREPSAEALAFMDMRIRRYSKPFVKAEGINTIPGDCVYICIVDRYGKLKERYEDIVRDIGVSSVCYGDSATGYSPDGTGYIEILHKGVSKGTAMDELRKITGFGRIVSFGDNYNDIPMIERSDDAYAVRNGRVDLDGYVSGYVGPAEDQGVTRKIAELEGIALE